MGPLLDRVERQIKDHVFFDVDHKYVVTTLWVVGTRFLAETGIRVFDAFPMLGFMSPEPDSGKSRALKVAELLSHNSLSAGSYTTASLLATIDGSEDIITICLDEIDTIFAHGKDNADLIRLCNLGYERGAKITRCRRFAEGTIETPAYCPKAFAGLKVARIPAPTKTRTIIVNMRPKTDEATREYVDVPALLALNEDIEGWAKVPSTISSLKDIELPEASFLNNRNAQIWKPLLAVAKITSADWYERALEAARFFIVEQPEAKNLSHVILLSAYRVFRSGEYQDRIHTCDLLSELQDLGIPKWVEAGPLSDCLSSYDEQIRPRQMKIRDVNRNGYDWHTFLGAFKTYIAPREVQEVERQLGLGPIPAVF